MSGASSQKTLADRCTSTVKTFILACILVTISGTLPSIASEAPALLPIADLSHRQCVNILALGADREGKNDAGPAFRSAIEANSMPAICVYFPKGTYRFASAPVVTLPMDSAYRSAAVAIIGDGSGLTILQPDPDVNGLTIHLNGSQQSFHIRDLSIVASNKGKSSTGLSIYQDKARSPNPAQSDIIGVSIHGKDGINGTYRFDRGIYLHQVSNVNLMNTAIVGSSDGAPYATVGTCLYLDGSHDSIPVQINIVSSQINSCQHGIHYGPYVQGIQILASNFVGNSVAIYQPDGNKGNDQLSIVGSQFNSGDRNIFLRSAIGGVSITGNDFYLADSGTASIEMLGVQFSIQGNCFIQLGAPRGSAISIGHYLLDAGIITGNSFDNFKIGLLLQDGSDKVNVQSNAYSNIATMNVIDKGRHNVIGGGSP